MFTVEAATIIAGATLGVVVLQSVLDAIGDVSRKVAIGIDNESGYKWTALNVYFYSGTSDRVMPYHVDSGTGTKFDIREQRGGMWVEKLHEVRFVILDANCTHKWKPIPFSITADIRNFFKKLMGLEALVFPFDRTLSNREWHYKDKVVVERSFSKQLATVFLNLKSYKLFSYYFAGVKKEICKP